MGERTDSMTLPTQEVSLFCIAWYTVLGLNQQNTLLMAISL